MASDLQAPMNVYSLLVIVPPIISCNLLLAVIVCSLVLNVFPMRETKTVTLESTMDVTKDD